MACKTCNDWGWTKEDFISPKKPCPDCKEGDKFKQGQEERLKLALTKGYYAKDW